MNQSLDILFRMYDCFSYSINICSEQGQCLQFVILLLLCNKQQPFSAVPRRKERMRAKGSDWSALLCKVVLLPGTTKMKLNKCTASKVLNFSILPSYFGIKKLAMRT